MSDTQCCASTTKKAWNNPLAPRARCEKKRVPGKEFCTIHQKRAEAREKDSPGSSKWMRSQFAPKEQP